MKSFKNLIIKSISLNLVLLLIVQVIPSIAFSSPGTIPLSSNHTSINPVVSNPALLNVPLDHVRVQGIHNGSNGRLIIYIQDAHTNYSAQMNISKSLEYLMKVYGIYDVLVEGAYDNSTLTPLRKLASIDVWERHSKQFLMRGAIDGVEYLNLTSDLPMKIHGIEDSELYQENLKTYLSIREDKKEALEYLHVIQTTIDRLKNQFYPKKLLDYENKKFISSQDKYSSGQLEEIYTLLTENKISYMNYEHFNKWIHLKELEEKIDYELLNNEIQQIYDSLISSDVVGQNGPIREWFLSSNSNIASQLALNEKIKHHYNQELKPLSTFEEYAKYTVYVNALSQVDIAVLMHEADVLENAVYNKLLLQVDQIRLRAIDLFIKYIQKAFHLRLTTHEFNTLKHNEGDFDFLTWQAFLNGLVEKTGHYEFLVPYNSVFEELQGQLNQFYSLVGLRDEAFITNINSYFEYSDTKSAYLVTGGYHTDNLTRILKKHGYSIIVLTPLVQHETEESVYENHLEASYKAIDYETLDGLSLRHRPDDLMAVSSSVKEVGNSVGVVSEVVSQPNLLVGGSRLSADEVPWWQDPDGRYLVESVPVYAMRQRDPSQDAGKGTFLGLALYYTQGGGADGAHVIHLMPHFARANPLRDEGIYAPASEYAVDELGIEWAEVPEIQSLLMSRNHSDAVRNHLIAPVQHQREVHYPSVVRRDEWLSQQAYSLFVRQEQGRNSIREKEFQEFIEINAFWLKPYAEFMALTQIIGKHALRWTTEEVSQAKNSDEKRYEDLVGRYQYNQWIAYGQLKEMLNILHQHNKKVLFDMPKFRSKNSVAVWHEGTRKYFDRPEDDAIYPGIDRSDVDEHWGNLAAWNWKELIKVDYDPILKPIAHWLDFGFDGGRDDATHFAYDFPGQLPEGQTLFPGDHFIGALADVFGERNKIMIAEAWEEKGPHIEGQFSNIIVLDGNAKRLRTHDDPALYTKRGKENGNQHGSAGAVDFMFDVNNRWVNYGNFKNDRARFVLFTLGDRWGDVETVKSDEGRHWRYRIPMPEDADFRERVAFDIGPYLFQRTNTFPFVTPEEMTIWDHPESIRAAFEGAADSFVNRREDGLVDIWASSANEDWFNHPWGRDAFIALTGVLLSNGRFEDAKTKIRFYAENIERIESLNRGLVPNRVWNDENKEYNGVDGSMWFIQAIKNYVEYSGDWDFAEEMMDSILTILTSYRNGTYYHWGEHPDGSPKRHDIKADPADGLIMSPAQATWMDADPDGTGAITPRDGKVVEINAMWYSNLRFAANLQRQTQNFQLPIQEGVEENRLSNMNFDDLADLVKASFNEKFWDDERSVLRDLVESQYDSHMQDAIRPNMVIAAAQGDDLLSHKQKVAVFEVAEEKLWTPFGPKTSIPGQPGYVPYYNTRDEHGKILPSIVKDPWYHQGTVWPHLAGPHIDLLVQVRLGEKGIINPNPAALHEIIDEHPDIQREVRELLTPLIEHLLYHGSIHEVFDAEPRDFGRQLEGGTRSQAWSVSEPLRVLKRYGVISGNGKRLFHGDEIDDISLRAIDFDHKEKEAASRLAASEIQFFSDPEHSFEQPEQINLDPYQIINEFSPERLHHLFLRIGSGGRLALLTNAGSIVQLFFNEPNNVVVSDGMGMSTAIIFERPSASRLSNSNFDVDSKLSELESITNQIEGQLARSAYKTIHFALDTQTISSEYNQLANEMIQKLSQHPQIQAFRLDELSLRSLNRLEKDEKLIVIAGKDKTNGIQTSFPHASVSEVQIPIPHHSKGQVSYVDIGRLVQISIAKALRFDFDRISRLYKQLTGETLTRAIYTSQVIQNGIFKIQPIIQPISSGQFSQMLRGLRESQIFA